MRGRYAAFLLALSCVVLYGQNVPEQNITIFGNVTDSVTGRGISGALVILQTGPTKAEFAAMQSQLEQNGDGFNPKPPAVPVPRRAVTDANGKYSFTVPEPTVATIQVSHSGYLNGFKQALKDLAQGISVALVPTGVIEGHVVNGDGDPLPGVSLEMIQVQIQDGRKMLRPPQTVRTNDLGEYRFWNITPSSVYVKVAGYQGTYSAVGGAPAVANSSEAFPTVYYPAAPDRESATLIKVPAGQTLRADFSLTSRKSFRIRGVIQNAGSYQGLGVRLMSGEEGVGNRVSINPTSGAFQVYDVTPGSYTLQAFSRGRSVALGEANVAVDAEDVTGVTVALSTGVDVQGAIEHVGGEQESAIQRRVFSNGRPAPPFQPVQAIVLQPGRIPVTGTQPPAQVGADGHFTFKEMLPGKYEFKLNTFDEYIESMRSGTIDVLADGLEVGSASPEELRVTLRRGGGKIGGVVTGLRPGEPGTVALIRAAGLSGIPTIVQTFFYPGGGEVQFLASNLAPGEYQIYAWPTAQQVEYRNPEALRVFSGNAVAVSLHEHGEEQVTVKAIAMEPQ